MIDTKPRPFDDRLLAELAREHGTPLFVYDADVVRTRIEELAGFDVVRYAQKANSNLALLARMRAFGVEVDAVSAGEAIRALRAGFAPHEIVYTADVFDRAALALLAEHPMPVNLGSPDMLEQYAGLARGTDRPCAVILRVNPGFGHGHDRKVNTGGERSKHGIWHADLPAVVARAHELGLEIGGLHVHIGSGSDFENLGHVRHALRRLAQQAGPALETISTGGGLPIPYRAGEPRFDVARFVAAWRETRDAIERDLGRELRLEVEPGRYLVAEAGVLLGEVRAKKRSGGFEYLLLDAGFHNLVRPAMYGAYHQISIVGRDAGEHASPTVVAGPLCESADVFTQGRGGELEPQLLPAASIGDLACIHDAGAYAASMASNYNSQPHAAEVLVEGGRARLVRRRQSFDELLGQELV
jgi:diaminopimelate decarboxylase